MRLPLIFFPAPPAVLSALQWSYPCRSSGTAAPLSAAETATATATAEDDKAIAVLTREDGGRLARARARVRGSALPDGGGREGGRRSRCGRRCPEEARSAQKPSSKNEGDPLLTSFPSPSLPSGQPEEEDMPSPSFPYIEGELHYTQEDAGSPCTTAEQQPAPLLPTMKHLPRVVKSGRDQIRTCYHWGASLSHAPHVSLHGCCPPLGHLLMAGFKDYTGRWLN